MNAFPVRLTITLLALLGVGCATTADPGIDRPAYAIDCDEIGDLASESGDEPFEIMFRNTRAEAVDLYWIDYERVEERKRTIAPGEAWTELTYVTHPWVVRDASGQCVAAYHSTSRVLVDIR